MAELPKDGTLVNSAFFVLIDVLVLFFSKGVHVEHLMKWGFQKMPV